MTNIDSAIDSASKVVQAGAEALARLDGVVRSPAFKEATRLCYQCEGIIYIIGMGKSGLVGQKIAATLTSTGTPANYIHASEALHGDLGAIRPSDMVVLISKSGETKEVLHIIPFLKEQGNSVIAITNNLESTLAKGVDVTLPTLVAEEGCPLNLAPMTSSTATMTLGDALASALVTARGFKAEHFARFHPGGRLGWMLTAKVSDMLKPDSNPTIGISETLRNAVVALVACRLGGLSVVGSDGKLAGIVTDGDLKRIMINLEKYSAALDDTMEKVMTSDPVSIHLDATAAEAVEIMENRERQLSVLPVVDNEGRPVGILRLHDIIRSHL